MLGIASASTEIILIDILLLLLTVATVWILFYVSKRIFPDDFRQLQFF
jgi:predicted permease